MSEINQKIDPLLWNPSVASNNNVTGSTQGSTVKRGQYLTLSYPEELGKPRYPYYMMFYINASSKSTLVTQGAVGVVNAPSRSVGLGVTSNATLINFVNQHASAIAGEQVTALPVQKRLNIAMALPMPLDINFSHSANYNLIGSGILGSIIKTFTSENLKDGAKDMANDIPSLIASDAASVAGDNFTELANKLIGIARNQRKEQVFKGMEPRSFTFHWNLIPKTEKESNTIKDIIKFFKFNQYPEIPVGTSGLNVVIPNEVDIEFIGVSGNEMQSISKISTCVIDNVNVNYTAAGKWVAFDGTDNPVATQLSITFKEVEPMTRTQIAMGY
jgi:hypothetical protein